MGSLPGRGPGLRPQATALCSLQACLSQKGMHPYPPWGKAYLLFPRAILCQIENREGPCHHQPQPLKGEEDGSVCGLLGTHVQTE